MTVQDRNRDVLCSGVFWSNQISLTPSHRALAVPGDAASAVRLLKLCNSDYSWKGQKWAQLTWCTHRLEKMLSGQSRSLRNPTWCCQATTLNRAITTKYFGKARNPGFPSAATSNYSDNCCAVIDLSRSDPFSFIWWRRSDYFCWGRIQSLLPRQPVVHTACGTQPA